jgi:NitT/TauT family transport system substrate-binding protein
MDLAAAIEPVYGAPPLMNQQIEAGAVDAVLTYWHFSARLEAKGYRRLLGVEEAVRQLGIETVVPQLGYVFSEAWAETNPELVQAFADASREAKALLRASEDEWERIRPLTRAEDDATFETLKARFREGIPDHWGEAEQADAARLYDLLAKLGGEELVGRATELQPGTFWSPVTF